MDAPFTAVAASVSLSGRWQRDGEYEWRVVPAKVPEGAMDEHDARKELVVSRGESRSAWFCLGEIWRVEWRPVEDVGAADDVAGVAGAAKEDDRSEDERVLEEFRRWAMDDSIPKRDVSTAPMFEPPGLPSLWQIVLDHYHDTRTHDAGPWSAFSIYERLVLKEEMG